MKLPFLTILVLIFGFLLLLLPKVNAQTGKYSIDKANLYVGLYRPFISYNGFKVGIEHPLAGITKSRTRRNGAIKRKLRLFFFTANLGVYRQKRHQLGLFLNSELAFRHTSNSGLIKEVFLGAGYLKGFLPNTTYEVDDNGNVQTIKMASNNFFMPSLSLGLGQNIYYLIKKPMAIHFRVTGSLFTPNTTFAGANLVGELGITYNLLNPWFKKR